MPAPRKFPVSLHSAFPFLALLALATAACSGQPGEQGGPEGALEIGETGLEESGLRTNLDFEVFYDNVGTKGQSETRKVITSEAGYRSYFGHDAPWDVDFYTHWVVFYSAGTTSTGGFDATVEKIETSASGATLYVKTRLESPGANCQVSQASTKPYALVKFEKPYPRPTSARYTRRDADIFCAAPEPETCADISCNAGSHCVEASTGPKCVLDPCPGAGHRNAAGRCECNVFGICSLGTSWNDSASVCACE